MNKILLSFVSLCLAMVVQAQNQSPANTCGCEGKPVPEVLATINGAKISPDIFTPKTLAEITSLQQQVVDARKHELDLQINSALLEFEAKRRGITPAKLLELEVVSAVTPATDAEAQAFYDKNKARIPKEFKDAREDILGYLRTEKQEQLAKSLADRLRAASQVKILVSEATPPATPADRARVFATVNGRNITSADIEDSLRPTIYRVQQQVYELRKQDLDLTINDRLLAQEAQKRGISERELLTQEVAAKATPITDEAALKFFNENKDRITETDFSKIKYQIVEYLAALQKNDLSGAFAARLRQGASVQIFLTEPEAPVYQIATDDQPSKGNPKSRVTLVEFTDYQCPSCSQEFPILETLMKEYGDRVRLVVRDFPLSQHENAAKAAEAAEAAREQGKYWEYVTLLFSRQSALQVEKLKEYASEIGLNRTQFDAALSTGKFTEKVQRDQIDGEKIGVNATPSLFINGRPIDDPSYEGLKTAIDNLLKTTR